MYERYARRQDDTHTFDVNMKQFWIGTPAALVTMYLADSSSGKAGIRITAATLSQFRAMDLAGRTVCFVGTHTQVLTVLEEWLLHRTAYRFPAARPERGRATSPDEPDPLYKGKDHGRVKYWSSPRCCC